MTFGFEFDSGVPVLFENFTMDDGGKFFAALLLIFAFALATEGISFVLWWQAFTRGKAEPGNRQIVMKVLGSILYFLLRVLNYCQMLVAMTFNFWLNLAIAVLQFVAWYIF